VILFNTFTYSLVLMLVDLIINNEALADFWSFVMPERRYEVVYLILVLVLAVAGFTMISGLLILILEKSNLIGVLKALGSRDVSIRKIFLYYAMFIIGKGMLWGNIIGLLICFVQHQWSVVKLDAEMYYMDCVPVEFTWLLLPLNVAMFILSTAMLILPSMLIARIEPTKAIRFE
ncbi:MAG: hypothetical protein IJY75_01450, partial [Bacteroidaceae bacterium]|nr:hypothetical protein [Bacteroidaceae bacterium]